MSRSTKKVAFLRRAEPPAAVAAPPPPPHPETDETLLGDLLLLLSNLEYLRVQLASVVGRGKRGEEMQLLTFLMDEVVAVSERRQSGAGEADEFVSLLGEVGSFYTAAQAVRKRADGASALGALWNLFRAPADAGDADEEFSAAVQQFFDGIARLLLLFGRCFESAAAADEWEQASQVFLHDLRQTVDALGH